MCLLVGAESVMGNEDLTPETLLCNDSNNPVCNTAYIYLVYEVIDFYKTYVFRQSIALYYQYTSSRGGLALIIDPRNGESSWRSEDSARDAHGCHVYAQP